VGQAIYTGNGVSRGDVWLTLTFLFGVGVCKRYKAPCWLILQKMCYKF